jgi:anti-sigma factor RsiW
MSRFDDGILVAYVDGELDEAVAREVEAAAASDPELRRKIELLRLSGSIAREAFRDSEHKTSSPYVTQERSDARRLPVAWLRRVVLPVAASILAGLIGFQVGVWHGKPSEGTDLAENLIEEIAEYHAIYARETEHQVEVKADRLDEIESWFGERLQRKLRVPDLTNRGLVFRGARLLAVETQAVAELLYSFPESPNQPLALCITVGPSEGLPYKTEAQGDMTLALWGEHGFVYVLAGWLDRPTLAALAAELKPMLDEI